MNQCGDCKYYDDSKSFPGTGWCNIWQDFMKDNEDYECDSWEEEEDD